MTAQVGGAAHGSPPAVTRASLLGRYAGFASRFVAFVVDQGVIIALFALALAVINFAASVLTGDSIHWHRGDIWVGLAFAALFLTAAVWLRRRGDPV